MSDAAGHGTQQLDTGEVRHTLSIHDVERELVAAGVPRSHRQVVRYCETGMLDAVKVPGPSGAQWFVSPASLPKVIGDLRQWQAQRAGHTQPRPAMAEAKIMDKSRDTEPAMAGHVGQLEKRIEEKDDVIGLLKGQLVSKDEQIRELSTRYRETHSLLGAMQRMLAPLLGQGDPYKATQDERRDRSTDVPPAAT